MTGQKVIAKNRYARHQYEIIETYDAGLALIGCEVKSIRAGEVTLRDAYVKEQNGEVWLMNCHISPYKQGSRHNEDPLRPRKCLLHKREILRIAGKVAEKGLTVVALKLYFVRGKVKVELGLAKPKKLHDKRADIKKRDLDRQLRDYNM